MSQHELRVVRRAVAEPSLIQLILDAGPTCDVPLAGRCFALGKNKAYELARSGQFPVPIVKLGDRYRVPVAPLLAVLGLTDAREVS